MPDQIARGVRQDDPMMAGWAAMGVRPPAARDPRRNPPRSIDPANVQLLNAMTGASAFPEALDTASGARAVRGAAAGNPREMLSVIPGSDQFGLTDPRQRDASHFGFLGDTLLTPDMARLGLHVGKAGASGLAGMLAGQVGRSGSLVPETAAQFVPRPPVGQSPQGGRFIARTTPGASPRLRPKGTPPVVAPPPQGPTQSLPSPPQRPQLEDLDPVKAYERLTAGWRGDPLAASEPRSFADPGRAVAQGARASKAFEKLSSSANTVPQRPVPTYQSPPEALAAHANPERVVGTEQAASNIARRAAVEAMYNRENSPGSKMFRAASNIGGLAQKGGNYLMGLLRGQTGGSVPTDKASIGFIRNSQSPLRDLSSASPAADLTSRLSSTIQEGMRKPAPPISSVREYNSVADLMRNGSRMYKQSPTGALRGVGGTPTMKSPLVDDYGRKAVAESFESNPDWQGFARPGTAMRPGIAAVAALKPGVHPSAFGRTVRHERTHAIMQEAGRRGNVASAKLPPAMKIPVQMQQSNSPVMQGLGRGFDEAAARAMEMRGPINQGVEGSKFLFNDTPIRRYYANQVSAISPTAGHLFNAIPQAARAGGTAATLTPAALLHAIRTNSEIDNGGY